jgi:hypothetical protein
MGRQLKDLGLSTTVELKVLDWNKKILYFTDVETSLDDVLVEAIQVAYTGFISPSGLPNFDSNALRFCYLTLANKKNEIYNRGMPMQLITENNLSILQLSPKLISIRNSFVELPQQGAFAAIPAGGAVMLFTFYYKRFNTHIHKVNGNGELLNDEDYDQ